MSRRILVLTALPLLVVANIATGCLSEGGTAPATTTTTDGGSTTTVPPLETGDSGAVIIPADAAVGDPTTNDAIKDSTVNITYLDDLANHPGCTTADLAGRLSADAKPAGYVPASLPDYACAAKEFAPLTEDPTKAIVILVHGNSSTPRDFETNADDPVQTITQIGNLLANDGWHVYEADYRFDKVYGLAGESSTTNPAKNMDHGWAVPIVESLIRSVHKKYPTQKINMAGFSLGSTIIRDALRRMHHAGEQPFSFVHALHLVSGANHGVNSYAALCSDPTNPTFKSMRSYVACQMGNRDAYSPTPFMSILNGPDGAWETPCADGINAFGQNNVCGANRVLYSTAVHSDKPDGTLEDEFVSETSAKLNGAANRAIPQDDTSKYFYNGFFPHHYGAIRSQPGVDLAKQALER